MPDWCNKHPGGAEQCSYLMGKVRKSTQHHIEWTGLKKEPLLSYHVMS